MKTILSNEDELSDFINQKIKPTGELNQRKAIFYFYKMVINSLENTYIKLNNTSYSMICCEIINNIYWTLLTFTNNIKLGMFLCDRGIILFQEYIYIYNNNKLYSNIRLEDVKQFIYKKTIGPLSINTKKIYHPNTNKMYMIANYIKELYQHIFKICRTTVSEKQYQQYISYLCAILEPELYKMEPNTIIHLYNYLPFSRISNTNVSLYINLTYVILKNIEHIDDNLITWIDELFLQNNNESIDSDQVIHRDRKILKEYWVSESIEVNESKLSKMMS